MNEDRAIRDETDQVLQDEANALAMLLANEERSVMVHVTIAYNNEEGEVRHGHGVAGATKRFHVSQFIMATERHLSWLRNKLCSSGKR